PGRWPNEALTGTPLGDILASSYLRGASVMGRIVPMTSLAAGRIETDERSQQRKFEHDRRLRRGFAAGAFVEAMGRHIRLIGEDPRLGAPEPPSALEEGLEKPARESAPPVRLCDTDLVDPELGRLVGVDVMHRRGHPDDHPCLDGSCEVMPRIREELGTPVRVDRLVEDVCRDGIEEGGV